VLSAWPERTYRTCVHNPQLQLRRHMFLAMRTGREIEPGPEIDGEMLVSRPGSFRLFTWLFPFYPSHFIPIDVHLFLVAQPDNLQFFSGFGAVRVDFYSVSQV